MDGESDLKIRERRLTLPGRGPGEVAVLDFGPPDRPVDALFLHANGFNARTYRERLLPLAARFRILAYDQRGHGLTTLAADPEGREDWNDLRDDLLAFLEVLDLRDIVLAGHSMGGTVSLLASAVSPRPRRLTLFDPVILPSPTVETTGGSPMIQGALRRRARFSSPEEALTSYRGRGAFRTWPDDMLRDYVAAGLRDLPEGGFTLACAPAWEASNYGAHRHDSWAALRNGTLPIDILTAESGSTFRRDADHDPADLAPRVQVATIPGTTHFLPMERADIFAAALTAAIEDRPWSVSA